ncbi:hypothetical protein BDQ17DRAFT_1425178 [Cyathus striatus]|nr:hypothetical protein BDQ17DRAFT_1425178 [Cyathus striatus]
MEIRPRAGRCGYESTTARNRGSPGVDRKRREGSSAHVKKKRRISIGHSSTTATTTTTSVLLASSSAIPPPPLDTSNEDDHIDIDEPWTDSYVPLSTDIIPHADTRAKLRHHAQNWRGITALTSTPSPSRPTIPKPPLAPFNSATFVHGAYRAAYQDAIVHYAVYESYHTIIVVPLRPTQWLRASGYAKAFPEAVSYEVDADQTPSFVLCFVLKRRRSDTALSFGIFAVRDLKASEEVVLGWEWDDGNAIHSLPALIESPQMFP